MGIVATALIAVFALLQARRGLPAGERSLVQLGFLAHVLGTCAIVAYHTYVTAGDMLGYAFYGRQLAHLMELDTGSLLDVCKLAVHLPHNLPPVVNYDFGGTDVLEGSTTTSMFALSGLVMFVVGTDLFSACVVFSLFAYAGSTFLYKQLRPSLLAHERRPFLIALLFVPSVVFWSSGIVKEAALLGFFGILAGGLAQFFRTRNPLSLPLIAVGAIGVGIVKPYAIFPLALAVGAWLDSQRGDRHGWLVRIVALLVAVGGLVALSWIFPQFGADRLAESVAMQQSAVEHGGLGRSTIEIGAPEERTLGGQLRFVPLALINAFARPFIFEAHNAAMMLAGVETLVGALLLFGVLSRHGARASFSYLLARPPLVASAVFALSFGAAVGLATTNLGTLSRYRLPMMPFYLAVLVGLYARPQTRTVRKDIALEKASSRNRDKRSARWRAERAAAPRRG